ncbi:MAG: two-component regulator propeller domain-containing protein, partial [Chitinophagales bacterium]
MQRTVVIFACFFIWANCLAQQYPFLRYTPKDGLISNQIRSIYQDSKGRLYFNSVNGLSVYDGSRFINYTSKNGLGFDIVNCVMEMGDDSVWIVTNSDKINCLVNGRLKFVTLKDPVPVINNLCRDNNGTLYAATDQGLYFFEKDKFVQMPFANTKGKDINTYIAYLLPFDNYLLAQRDNSILRDRKNPLYLYNTGTKKITAELPTIYAADKAPDGRIWVSTDKSIMAVDTTELKEGKLNLQELPSLYDKLKNLGKYFIQFDREGNCWLGDQNNVLVRCDFNGNTTAFTTASGLSMPGINRIFLDKEGITWIATSNNGIDKLVHSNFSFIENPFGVSSLNDISYYENKNQLWIFSDKNAKALVVRDDTYVDYYEVKKTNAISQLVETPNGVFGLWGNTIYKINRSGNRLYPEIIVSDTTDNEYNGPLVDKNGNLILCGRYDVVAIVNAKTICRSKLNFLADHASLDSKGNIWVATRASELIMYEPRPDDPSHYLEQKNSFSKELSGISPRSITIDKNDNIWIGTRSNGIHVFSLKNGILDRQFIITADSGLSDNFITHLSCGNDNNIYACSPSGLDRITVRNGTPVIENLTRQNNIYQRVYKVVIDKNNTVWGLVSNGLIKIISENKPPTDYSPRLMISMVKAGKDTVAENSGTVLTYKQNNLSFYFAATSFLDEKQVLYSHRLQGSSNTQWSEPSNNASVSFINLHPGNYTLKIKATFPASRYPEQIIQYKFSIAPPWWQTWWFKVSAGSLIIGLLIITTRFYYRRKLEKQKLILEKQQAIEKERTRIATDMHDDLGAGLSRIKFLSQSILNKKIKDEIIITELEKITSFSDEMSEKMGEIVWALNEKNDTLADLIAYTRSYVVEYLANHNIECEANTPMHLPGTFIPGEMRRNIFLSVKECLHNIVKHA